MLSRIAKVLAAFLGVAALLLAGIALMPARAVRLATDQVEGLMVGSTEGRLFSGQAELWYRGVDLGRMAWSFRPGALLGLELRADWRVAHRDFNGWGTAALGAGTTEFGGDANIEALAVNRFLAQYHILVDGTFEVRGLAIRRDPQKINAEGTLRWTGGRTTYRLSGQMHDVELPGMVATLASVDGEPVLEVVSVEDAARLLSVRLDGDGWAHIGVTARLTALAGNPWRHDGDEDAVVVTVSERLFQPVGRGGRVGRNVPVSGG
ncbi:MAG: type II secretion system protein N [Gammaproteobacteria bacterium]|nr:type II secretion system protein N [Gammaproteobacteria bacterium]